VHGWRGKVLVLILLGFAATDFVVTRTLSVADAAEHLIHNPLPIWQRLLHLLGDIDDNTRDLLPYDFWHEAVGHWKPRLVIALILSALGFVFWSVFRHGFRRRVIQIAVVVVTGYLALNAFVIGSSLVYIKSHPDLLRNWWAGLPRPELYPAARLLPWGSWWSVLALCLISFPKMSLGLSGFELSMVVMPLVRDGSSDSLDGRVRNARKMLLAAVAIMSVYLLSSTLVTTILIPHRALVENGPAANRALAYLAHGGQLADGNDALAIDPLFGETFGTIYDASTVVILCLAGTSVT